jgi:putative DNA primase/helicase
MANSDSEASNGRAENAAEVGEDEGYSPENITINGAKVKPRLEAARQYLARGWCPIPVRHREKRPGFDGWATFTVAEADLLRHFAGVGNIGVLLGEKSNGLVDVDLDCPEAVALALHVLPPTDAIFGRQSRPRSHWLYACDPPPPATVQHQFGNSMIVELRSTGGQTVFPLSLHLDGEVVEWASDGQPARIAAEQLLHCVSDLAGLCLLVRNWPELNGRYNVEGALIGALLRAGRAEDEVVRLIAAIQRQKSSRDHTPEKSVPRLAAKLAEGKPVPGLNRLKELLGADIAGKAAEWLGLQRGLVLYPENPRPSARAFVVDCEKVLRCHAGDIYEWQESHYRRLDDSDIRAALYTFLEGATYKNTRGVTVPFAPNTAKVNNTLDALKALVHLPSHVTPSSWISGDINDRLLACRNGLLRLKDKALLPHSSDFFNLAAAAFDYDPNAPKPVEWLKFLGTLWPDDTKSITALQEQMGYVLSGDGRRHKMFLHIGPPRSGKGTILRVLEALLGGSGHVSLPLSSILGEFGLEPLIGKILAAVPDARLSGRSAPLVERLLAISGGDDLTVGRKYKGAVTLRLAVRFWFLSNVIPKLADGSGTIASRFVILQYKKSFLGNEDLALEARLMKELAGILNWAIEGWSALEKRGAFTQPQTGKQAMRNMRALTSVVIAFIEDEYVVDPLGEVETIELFRAFQGWFERTGQQGHAGTETAFGIHLAEAFTVNKVRRMVSGDRRNYYQGLRLKELVPF